MQRKWKKISAFWIALVIELTTARASESAFFTKKKVFKKGDPIFLINMDVGEKKTDVAFLKHRDDIGLSLCPVWAFVATYQPSAGDI